MHEKPLAYEAYQKLADAYAAGIDTKPHNAYYDRPAMLSLLPEIDGKMVLDAGCGPGAYSEALVARGATVIGCDASDRMLELAEQRLQGTAELIKVDLTRPLNMFQNNQFDLINAGLCLDYIEDWESLFHEFRRMLKPGGMFLFSCGHPSFDAEYFDTQQYFSVERVEATWSGFGIEVRMPSFRRSLQAALMPVINSGLLLDQILEPLPTDEFKAADPIYYQRLMHRPGFLCVRCRKTV